jgi:hypothetical protein
MIQYKTGKDKQASGPARSQGSTVTPSTIAHGSRHMLPGPAVVSAQSQTWSHFVDFPEMQALSTWSVMIGRIGPGIPDALGRQKHPAKC